MADHPIVDKLLGLAVQDSQAQLEKTKAKQQQAPNP